MESRRMDYTLGYSEIVDVSQPDVWSVDSHSDFSPAYRSGVRGVLLALSVGRGRGRHILNPISVLESLSLFESGDSEYCGGVAYVRETPDAIDDYVLYNVSSAGVVSYPDGMSFEDVPFKSSLKVPPPATCFPQAHREYLFSLDIDEFAFMYPELFDPSARRRSCQKRTQRAYPFDYERFHRDPDLFMAEAYRALLDGAAESEADEGSEGGDLSELDEAYFGAENAGASDLEQDRGAEFEDSAAESEDSDLSDLF